jgi:hypothetical protein
MTYYLNKALVAIVLPCNLEAQGSNLGPETGYPDGTSRDFSSFPTGEEKPG